jgi:hypothetical protein
VRRVLYHPYRAGVTCQGCLRRQRVTPPANSEAQAYAAVTTLVDGRRRAILPCECGAAMVAGIDHTCDPDDRRDGGLRWR